jgi:hypothetical protein
MHNTCKKWMEEMKQKYPANFVNAKVLELGAVDAEQCVPRLLENCEHVGIDKMEGYQYDASVLKSWGVDFVMDAVDTKFEEEYFDTLICLSMFEHDVHWQQSLAHNLPFLKKGGLILLLWGAEGNGPHGMSWKPVTSTEFAEFVPSLPITVIDKFFGDQRYGGDDCPGAYHVEAIKTIV